MQNNTGNDHLIQKPVFLVLDSNIEDKRLKVLNKLITLLQPIQKEGYFEVVFHPLLLAEKTGYSVLEITGQTVETYRRIYSMYISNSYQGGCEGKKKSNNIVKTKLLSQTCIVNQRKALNVRQSSLDMLNIYQQHFENEEKGYIDIRRREKVFLDTKKAIDWVSEHVQGARLKDHLILSEKRVVHDLPTSLASLDEPQSPPLYFYPYHSPLFQLLSPASLLLIAEKSRDYEIDLISSILKENEPKS